VSWDESTLLQAIARLTERAERAERMLRRAELEYVNRIRRRTNRRAELRRLHKAVARWRAAFEAECGRHRLSIEHFTAEKAAMAKCTVDAIEYLRGRVAELEGRK
jgi:hypothetical protein